MDAVPSYDAVHARLNRQRGPASAWGCVFCGWYASDWAYMHQTDDEIVDPAGLRYSTDPDQYKPLCSTCHRALDVRVAAHGREGIAELLTTIKRVPALTTFPTRYDGFGGVDTVEMFADYCEKSQEYAGYYLARYRVMCREIEYRPVGAKTFVQRLIDDHGFIRDQRNGLIRLTAPWHGGTNPYDEAAEMAAHIADLRAAGSHWLADHLESAYARRSEEEAV